MTSKPRYQVEIVAPPEWKGGMNCYVIDTHEANSRCKGVWMDVASAQRIADILNGYEAIGAKARAELSAK